MPDLLLEGCTPTPMGSYLKAVGLLRIVGRQVDAEARGWWRADTFRLRSRLNEGELVEFLVGDYRPTPVVSPWNGGSGFYPKDARHAIDSISASRCDRLNPYREAIVAGRVAVAAADRWPPAVRKERLVTECRGAFSDAAVEWLDCAICFTVEGLQYPPLLISGGNDGRLEFSNNFMQRLCDVLPELAEHPQVQVEQSRRWLRDALSGRSDSMLREVAAGLFDPGAACGANATAGFEGASLVNPWDYVLTIEGSLLFAAATARRLGRIAGPAIAAFPFTVRPSAAGVLWGGSEAERVRAEVWMPLWGAPATLAEVQNLCSEGRAEWRGRQAADALDFAKALASLGVARGVDGFVRFGLSTRMGRAHVAVPLRRMSVRRRPEVDLLAAVDPWLGRVRGLGQNLPARLASALQRVERASFDLCLRGGARAVQEVLVELARAELALAANPRLADQVGPLVLESDWFWRCDDGSPELRLAAAMASLRHPDLPPVRAYLEPVVLDRRGRPVWRAGPSQVWAEGPGRRNLAAILQRRLLDAAMAGRPREALVASWPARLQHIDQLLAGLVDLERLADLLKGLAMVRWWPVRPEARATAPPTLARAYAVLKLCLLPFPLEHGGRAVEVPPGSGVSAALAAARVGDAVRLAAARLRASGLPPHRAADVEELAAYLEPELLQVALLAPVSPASARALAQQVLV